MVEPPRPLRRGWTTGACAAAAAKSAWHALITGRFLDPVTIVLPRGGWATFSLDRSERGEGWAQAAIIKDAGDDPDITHGARIEVTVRRNEPGLGVTFAAGAGVGRVTRAGLPLPPGEPAINPAPRQMIAHGIGEVSENLGTRPDCVVTISIPGGEALAQKTLNPRLGIEGGLSILGTTGIVVPFSCAAWIHSIHRGIDVARAGGIDHIAVSTGSTSEAAVQRSLGLESAALIEMGDFVGATLKYLRRHPVAKVTIAGGFAKIGKLAQGASDLHSKRSALDLARLQGLASDLGFAAKFDEPPSTGLAFLGAFSAQERQRIADEVSRRARAVALDLVDESVLLDVMIFDREGGLLGHAPGW